MKIYPVVIGDLQVNSYFVTEDGENAVVIDCGDDLATLKQTAQTLNLKIGAVILTHAHFDHSGSASALQQEGVKIYISEKDAPKLSNKENLSWHFGIYFEELSPDYTFSEGQILELYGLKFKIIETPGHTDGSVCLVAEDNLFSGDTLFNLSVGRTDFPTGDFNQLKKSIQRLFKDYDGYKVYPGHGPSTTISYEKKFNPINNY